MSPYSEDCVCGNAVTYQRSHCSKCRKFLGAPNVRLAKSMRDDLGTLYRQAVACAHDYDLDAEVERLEDLLTRCVVTIALEPALLRSLAEGDAYRSYYNALSDGAREIAIRENQAERGKVDAQIHAGYHEEIVHAALSPDGRALTHYGSVAAVLKTIWIRPNASLLRENDYDFYVSMGLGQLKVTEAPGWRAVWEDRALLGVAKLAADLKPGATDDELADLILSVGEDRSEDRYIEVHIYGQVTASQIAKVRKAKPGSGGDDIDWDYARERLEGEMKFEEAGDDHI